MSPANNKNYESLDAFYDDVPGRRRSGEADYGVGWTKGGRRWPYWRVSYVHATGEVYAVEVTLTGGPVEVLGVVPPDEDDGWRRTYYRTLDRLLDGWADEPHRSIDWVRDRLVPGQSGAERE